MAVWKCSAVYPLQSGQLEDGTIDHTEQCVPLTSTLLNSMQLEIQSEYLEEGKQLEGENDDD